jgi:sn-glycerol 3-phosphate transport system ATP-binding protein
MADIAIRKVRKSYGRNAVVHGVDLDIDHGEFVVILGPSGCGKSTLLRMIAGLEAITDGEIAIAGQVVNKLEPRERGCAMVFQNYALYPHMSVADNIGYALRVAGVPRVERRTRVEAMAKIVGLEGFLDRKPGQLSGGQRQRVAMARAMIREPKVFLFDEPLSNLDAKLRGQMRVEIRRLHRRLGATSVFVTHDQVEAMTLADRLVVMNGGRIEQVGTPGEVYRRPATRFVAGFIGSPPMNILPGRTVPGGVEIIGNRVLRLSADLSIAGGRSIEVGIRPEDVQVVDRDAPGVLPIDVDLVEELGPTLLCHGRLDTLDFVVSVPADTRVAAGSVLAVAVAPAALHLFDTDSARRIDGAAPSVTRIAAA